MLEEKCMGMMLAGGPLGLAYRLFQVRSLCKYDRWYTQLHTGGFVCGGLVRFFLFSFCFFFHVVRTINYQFLCESVSAVYT